MPLRSRREPVKKYLLIESSDPFESTEPERCYELAAQLAKEGNEVTLFLIQNGVFAARSSVKSKRLEELAKKGVTVLADDFSLKERGIINARLAGGVKPAPID